jgi:hypothetical protein
VKKRYVWQRTWLRRHSALSDRRRLRFEAAAAARRQGTRRLKVFMETQEGQEQAWASNRTPMPENFCLESNYEQCIERLRSLRTSLSQSARQMQRHSGAAQNKRARVASFLDFSTIKQCTPATALVLAAEYDRARSLLPSGGIRLVNLKSWRTDLVEMLDEIGFFDLLQIPRPQTGGKRSDVSVVRFQTGSTFGNTEAGSLMKTLATMIVTADHVDALNDPITLAARLRLYSALVEACENTRRHAYPAAASFDPAVRRWWMTGAVHRAEKRLTLVVYDQGVTIPGSLPSWLGYSWIKRALTLLSLAPLQEGDPSRDGLVLRLAMNSPRSSSTGLEHRGKGFPAFKQVIKECERGKLRIVSRHGEFIYEKGRRPFGRQLESPLEGTLVEWDLWL